jgi:hypothetical protein
MRVVAVCAVCVNKWEKDSRQHPERLTGELQDSGIVLVDCPQGHKSVVLFDARRYEVLMRSGARALLSDYCNEAVASFASALERAYEFYLRVVFRDRKVPAETFRALWREVDVQSERQLGAFQFVHFLESGSHLRLNPEIANIRNRIIHRGHIATRDVAMKFAELVYERIKTIEKSLGPHSGAVEEEAKYEIDEQKKVVPEGMDNS